MKKTLLLLISVLLSICLVGCTSKDNKKPTKKNEKEEQQVETKGLKILAIGNSFSIDCMEYLYDIFKQANNESVVLGNLVYSGCSIQQHYEFATGEEEVYTYKKNNAGYWNDKEGYTLSKGLKDEQWDIITIQQTSKTSGLEEYYDSSLTGLIDFVKEFCPNAKLVFNMTWAYQQDSTHSSFPNYDKDQLKMYNMIVDCVSNCIETNDDFAYVIPVGTAIQNARTSFIGDTLTRDGYHLDKLIGRYIAALTWYCKITGKKAETLKAYNLNGLLTDYQVQVAIESVDNALTSPKQITQSEIVNVK